MYFKSSYKKTLKKIQNLFKYFFRAREKIFLTEFTNKKKRCNFND